MTFADSARCWSYFYGKKQRAGQDPKSLPTTNHCHMFLDEIDTLRIRQNNALSATGDLDPDLYVMLYLGDLGWTIYEAVSLFCSGPSLSYAVFFMSCFSRVKT